MRSLLIREACATLNTLSMKHLNRIFVLGAVLLAVVLPLHAQTVVYTCDFEDASEITNNWQLNYQIKQSTLPNNWYVGAPGQFGLNGQNGLYIAPAGNNAEATYSNSESSSIVAFRDLTMLTTGQVYTITFDYKVAGNAGCRLEAWWLPTSKAIVSKTGNHPTDWATVGGQQLGGSSLYGSAQWKSISATFTHTQAGRLVFAWVNDAGAVNPPSACIDNVVITEGTACAPAPRNVNFANNRLSWQASAGASAYEVILYNCYTNTFLPSDTVTTTSWQAPTTLSEGNYLLYVRTLCPDGQHTNWVSSPKPIVILNRCINYTDLAKLGTTCYYGTFSSPMQSTGVVDHGYESILSRHTVHYMIGERDERTNYQLPTIPPGEIASVRLGNWETGAKAEAIEFLYPVQKGASDIMDINYAIVMEDPNHDASEQPRFTLEILDARTGQQIGGLNKKCYSADFTAGGSDKTGSGWHVEGTGSNKVNWKEWTTVSISLTEYVGRTLKIRFTTKDCSQSGHYGYAYFTINCRGGQLEGLACGVDNTDHFTAPSGSFNYHWYKQANPDEVLYENDSVTLKRTDSAVFMIDPQDTTIYNVEVISKLNGCSFTLVANPNPRYPKTVVDTVAKEWDCTNTVTFSNTSYVEIITRNKTGVRDTTISEDPIDDVVWDWGDGSAPEHSTAATISHTYPKTGGKFYPTISAIIADGGCENPVEIELDLPDLTVGSVENTKVLCRSQYPSYTFQGKVYTEDADIEWDTLSIYNCAVKNILHLRFADRTEIHEDSTICEGQYVEKWGKKFMVNGLDSVFSPEPDESGCNSVYFLNLTVNPVLQFEVDKKFNVCPEDEFIIPFKVPHGDYSSIVLTSSKTAQAAGFDAEYAFEKADIKGNALHVTIPGSGGTKNELLKAGKYTFTVKPNSLFPACFDDEFPITLEVSYSSDVIVQRGSYLFLYDADHNGGYNNWTTYQWYYNGQPMVGYTTPQILMPDTTQTASYFCMITDADGFTSATCPVSYKKPIFVGFDNVDVVAVHPTMLAPGETIYMSHGGYVELFDALGRLVYAVETDASLPSEISAPASAGMYLLRVGQSVTRVIVK